MNLWRQYKWATPLIFAVVLIFSTTSSVGVLHFRNTKAQKTESGKVAGITVSTKPSPSPSTKPSASPTPIKKATTPKITTLVKTPALSASPSASPTTSTNNSTTSSSAQTNSSSTPSVSPSPSPSPTTSSAPQPRTVCEVHADKTNGPVPLTVNFYYGATTYDSRGVPGWDDVYVTDVQWDFKNDGTWDTPFDTASQRPSFTYEQAGNYTVRMHLKMNNGYISNDCTGSITVN